MKKQLKIAVVEPSDIIRNGIVATINGIPSISAELFEIMDTEHLVSAINSYRPDIIIANSSVFGAYSIARLKKDIIVTDLRFIALKIALSEVINASDYDEIINISDSAEQIKEKLQKASNINKIEQQQQEVLSQREKEVVACVVKGMTNKQIADSLHLSVHTIITHRRNIAAKLDIHSTAGLTIYAIAHNLIKI